MVDILSTKYKERQGTDKEKLLGKFGKAFSRMFFTGLPCSRLPETPEGGFNQNSTLWGSST